MANNCDAVLIGICWCHRVALYGQPVVEAVGERQYEATLKL